MKKILFIIMITIMVTGCDLISSSDSLQNQRQEELSKQSVLEIGLPNIINFQEKRVFKQIIELRDTKVSTITYIRDMNGNLHKVCNSIGFGIPYATQYTNPSKIHQHSFGNVTLPQADPNGLFSPASAEGTWVLCSNPKKPSEVAPVYIEDRITVSPFELQ
jgi:hypothetical protein